MQQSVLALIDALASISPMPDDESPDMTSERLHDYEQLLFQVKDIVDHSPEDGDPRLIDALITSFGYGHGFELYWTAVAILEKFPPDELVPRLRRAVQNGRPGARQWAAYMLGRQRDPRDAALLITVLTEPQPRVREQALVALGMIGDSTALPPRDKGKRSGSCSLVRSIIVTFRRSQPASAWSTRPIGSWWCLKMEEQKTLEN